MVASQPLSGLSRVMAGAKDKSATRRCSGNRRGGEPLPEQQREAQQRQGGENGFGKIHRRKTNRKSGVAARHFVFGMFVEDEHAVRREVVVAGEGVAGEEIVHGLVKLDAHGRILVVEQKKDAHAFLLAHADFDVFGHFEQGLQAAHLAQPRNEVVIKMLVAHRADVNGLAEAEVVHGHGGAAGVKILRVSRQNLAALRLDDVAPKPRGMQMAGRERALEGEMIFLAGRNGVEFQNFQAEQIGHVVRIPGVGRDVMLVHQAGVERADERAAVLDVKFQAVGLAGGEQVQRRRENDFVLRKVFASAARNPRRCCGRAARCR